MIKAKLSLFIIFALIVGLTGATGAFIAVNMSKANKVIKEKLEFVIEKDEKVYDGSPLELKEIELAEDYKLPNGYTYDFICNDTITNVGKIYPSPNIIIYDNYGKNVTSLYDCIIKENGGLVVTQRPINVSYNSITKPYDGTPLNSTTYEIDNGTLALGQRFAPEYLSEANSIDDGKVKIQAVSHVLDINGTDVTDNYYITDNLTGVDAPTFEITGNKLVVYTTNYTHEYDGKPHMHNSDFIYEGLRPNDRVIITESTTVINVSDSGVNDVEKDAIDIVNADGISVKDKYEIEIKAIGRIEITPYVLVVSVPSSDPIKSVVYTGETQKFEITDEELAEMHLFEQTDLDLIGENYKIAGTGNEGVNVGIYPVTLSVVDDFGNVSENFKFDPSYRQKLFFEIIKRRVIVTLKPLVDIEYDGKPHGYKGQDDEYTVAGDGLLNGHSITFDYEAASFIDVGTHVVPGVITIVNDDEIDITNNYDTTVNDGKVIIKPRKVKITLREGVTGEDLVKNYTGAPLFNAEELFEVIDELFEYKLSFTRDFINEGKYFAKDFIRFVVIDGTGYDEINFELDTTGISSVQLEIREDAMTLVFVLAGDENYERQYNGTPVLASEIFKLSSESALYLNRKNYTCVFNFEDEYINYRATAYYIDFEDDVNVSIFDEFGNLVNIEYELLDGLEPSLKINRCEVVIQTGSASKTYDGNPLYCYDYSVIGLPTGFSIVLDEFSFNSITESGSTTNDINGYDIRYNGVSVSDNNFDVAQSVGMLYVYSATLNVFVNNVSVTYGDYNSVYEMPINYTVSGSAASLPGLQITLDLSNCDIDAGTYPVYIDVDYGDLNPGSIVASIPSGTLVVKKKEITLQSQTLTKEYDGYTFNRVNTINGYDVEYYDYDITDAGIYSNVFYVSNYDSNNYVINYIYGTLTITKKKITLQSQTLTKEYDGESFDRADTISGYEVTYNNNNIVNVGIYSNEFYVSGYDLNNNYEFTYLFGTLTITKKKVTLQSPSISKEYDGDTFERSSTLSGYAVVYTDNTMVDAGTYVNEFYASSQYSSSNYEFTYIYGTLTITKVKVNVITNSFTVNLTDGESYDPSLCSVTIIGSSDLSSSDFSPVNINPDEEFGNFYNVVEVINYSTNKNYDITYFYGTISYI